MFRSLRWRIPLFVSALVVVTLATLLFATRRELESTLVRAARDRAAAVAQQFAEPVGRGMRANLEENSRLAGHPAIRAFVANPASDTREMALTALAPRAPGLFRRVEIWSDDGSRLLEISTPGKTADAQTAFFPSEAAPTRTGISDLRGTDQLSYFTVTSEIDDGAAMSRRIGYLRRYGRVTYSGNVKNLVGAGSMVRVGSSSGTWTDMFTVASAPPNAEPRSNLGEHHAPDGRRWVGAGVPIEGTSWITWVGFPRDPVVAPAQPFMRRMILLALAFVAVGVGTVALLSIRVARRVQVLTEAADQIAGGDYSRRVRAGRHDDEIGQLSAAFNTMADGVEQAHHAVRDSHERTGFALAAARIGVWESHVDTGHMTCSDTVATGHGLLATAVPRTIDEFVADVHVDDRDAVRRVLEGRHTRTDMLEIQYRVTLPEGPTRWFEARGRRFADDRGRPAYVRGISVDVTEHRRLEAQLRQAQKMEAVGQLAGGVAHDFNNLLTAIVGHGNLALEDLPDDHRVRENVTEMLRAAERAAALTRQLLAFSRRQVMQPEVVTVDAVIAKVEKLLRRLIGEQIHIVLNLAAADAVKVDPGQLEQVLVNLAINARDAMPDGGTLTVSTATVDLDETYTLRHAGAVAGRHVMIEVSDTGTGMDAKTQARLFEPFFTTKPTGKGTGLGLAMVYGIVKQSGGFIYVYSEPGRGSTFKVYLPVTAEKPSTTTTPVQPAIAQGGAETILVVEDNPQVQAIAQRMLAKLGYRVLIASSGEDAEAVLDSADGRVNLVISDVIMPGMTGPELGRRLVTRYPDLRLLFTSGYSNDAIARHGVLEPGAMFIEKPYTPGALAQKVREALGQPARKLSSK